MPYQISNYVRKNENVSAVRLNEHNIKEIAGLIGGDYHENEGNAMVNRDPSIILGGEGAYLGDWVVFRNKENVAPVEFYDDEEFLGKYHSFSEALSESDRLAEIHKIIHDAMVAAQQGRPGEEGWEVVAMLAAKHVLTV